MNPETSNTTDSESTEVYLGIYEVMSQIEIPNLEDNEIGELFNRAFDTRLGYDDVTDDEIIMIKNYLNVPQYYKIGVHPSEMAKVFSNILNVNETFEPYYVFHIIPPIELEYKGFPIEFDLNPLNQNKVYIPWG